MKSWNKEPPSDASAAIRILFEGNSNWMRLGISFVHTAKLRCLSMYFQSTTPIIAWCLAPDDTSEISTLYWYEGVEQPSKNRIESINKIDFLPECCSLREIHSSIVRLPKQSYLNCLQYCPITTRFPRFPSQLKEYQRTRLLYPSSDKRLSILWYCLFVDSTYHNAWQ